MKPSGILTIFRIALVAFFIQGAHMKPRYRTHILPRDEETVLLTKATFNIIEEFYEQRTSFVYITRCTMTSPISYYRQSEIINHLLIATKSKLSYIIEEPKHLREAINLRYHNIFFVDGYQGFR